MNAPRRWVDDPETAEELRRVLREAPAARPLPDPMRRALRGKVARAAAVPALAAGWLLVKSAAAALGVVAGVATAATAIGVIEWPEGPQPAAAGERTSTRPAASVSVAPSTPVPAPTSEVEWISPEAPSRQHTATTPSSRPAASSAGSLSAEAVMLEQARRELRAAPSVTLRIVGEHAARFPRGQLGSERVLIQIEALHRLGRDDEARAYARGLLAGAAGGLYAERVRQLLGEIEQP